MHIYYRISDNSYQKPKLPVCSKEYCLFNFRKMFSIKDSIHTVIADNCTSETLEMYRYKREAWLETNLGNASSFRHALSLAVQLPPEEIVYFVEDDYIHDWKASTLIEEGPGDYWTVYDHPDKYGPMYDNGETTKLISTRHGRWKYTISTTMTFASRAGTLKEDMDIWMKHTEGPHPNDHQAFLDLSKKGRKLACSIPGRAWHVDLTESVKAGKLDMDLELFYFLLDAASDDYIDPYFKLDLIKRVDQEPFGPVEALAILEQWRKTGKTK